MPNPVLLARQAPAPRKDRSTASAAKASRSRRSARNRASTVGIIREVAIMLIRPRLRRPRNQLSRNSSNQSTTVTFSGATRPPPGRKVITISLIMTRTVIQAVIPPRRYRLRQLASPNPPTSLALVVNFSWLIVPPHAAPSHIREHTITFHPSIDAAEVILRGSRTRIGRTSHLRCDEPRTRRHMPCERTG